MIKTVSVQELCEQFEADPQLVLIDLRQSAEFEQGHVPQAYNIPFGSMPAAQILAEWGREAEGKPIYFICQSGGRSQQLIDELVLEGYQSAQCVAGGMVAWQAMGLLVERSSASPAVKWHDRWLGLTIGLLVILGCGLGTFLHRVFLLIPVVLALGLMVASLCGRLSGISLSREK